MFNEEFANFLGELFVFIADRNVELLFARRQRRINLNWWSVSEDGGSTQSTHPLLIVAVDDGGGDDFVFKLLHATPLDRGRQVARRLRVLLIAAAACARDHRRPAIAVAGAGRQSAGSQSAVEDEAPTSQPSTAGETLMLRCRLQSLSLRRANWRHGRANVERKFAHMFDPAARTLDDDARALSVSVPSPSERSGGDAKRSGARDI